MHRKVLFGVDYTNSELIKLILYLFVGGTRRFSRVGTILYFYQLFTKWFRFRYDDIDYVGNSFSL